MRRDECLGGAEPSSLEEILDARERRAGRQREMLSRHGVPLVSFTMNIPGEYKRFPLAEKGFFEGQRQLFRALRQEGFPVLDKAETSEKTGCEGLYAVDASADSLKRVAMQIEEQHALGRLFDIDVIAADGTPLSGAEFGRVERTCIVCGGPVWACARNRAHTAEELLFSCVNLLADFFDGGEADRVAGLAVRALLREVCVSPKPGLVDRLDSGAHSDMDIFTFVDSACALFPYFRSVCFASLRYGGEPGTLLRALRHLGLAAEEAMFRATGGVNTHKGAIFSLGILTAAAGYLYGRRAELTEEALFSVCAEIARPAMEEFGGASNERSHGKDAYRREGLTGVRGEAAAGFPSVRFHALPVYRECRERGDSPDGAGVAALFALLARTEDTNVVSRAGTEALQSIKDKSAAVWGKKPSPEKLLAEAAQLNRVCIAARISPGGSADLLAVTIFADSLLRGGEI